jgi:hypothetical protein
MDTNRGFNLTAMNQSLRNAYPDLLLAEKRLYLPMGLGIRQFTVENESADYAAAEFTLGKRQVKFRASKITPTKKGQFVTFWKRGEDGSITPYDLNDSFDGLIISTRFGNHLGQFIFPKSALDDNGILSSGQREGKRAFRVYASWDKAENHQAKKTQAWQLPYFIDISEKQEVDLIRINYLFNQSGS